MSAATLTLAAGGFDPAPPPRLLWVAAFVAVLAAHAAVGLYLLNRPIEPSVGEAPEVVTMIDLPPAPAAPGDSASMAPAAEAENAPVTAPDAKATSEIPDEAPQVSEAAAVDEPVDEPPPPEAVPEPPPLAAPAPMLEIPPVLEPPPQLAAPTPMLAIPPTLEPPIEAAPVVPEATVVLPAVVPPPVERPEPPAETKPAPVVRETPKKVAEAKKPTLRQTAERKEKAAVKATGAPAAEETVDGKPKSGAAPRAASGGTRSTELNRYLARVRAAIEQRARSQRGGQRRVVVVRFSFSRAGALSGVSIAKSSGDAGLDQAALAAVKRASPFPAAPASLDQASFAATLPIRFQ